MGRDGTPSRAMSAPRLPNPRLAAAAFLTHVMLHQVVIMATRVTTSYRVIELGLPVEWIGAIAASFSLLPLLIAMSTGALIDRRGERPVMLVGGACAVLGALGLLVLPSTILVLLGCNLLLGLAHLFCILGQHAYTAGDGDTAARDLRFGHYSAVLSLGQVIAPLLMAVIGGSGSVPHTGELFALGAIAAALSIGALLLTPARTRPKDVPASQKVAIRAMLRYRGVIPAIIVGIAVLCSIDLLLIYMPVLGTEALIPAATIGALLMVRAATSMLSRLVYGRLIRAIGRRLLLTAAMAAITVGLAVLAFPVPIWVMFVAMLLAGFGIGVATPLTLSWITGIVPVHARGLVLSIRISGNRLGQFGLPLVAGFAVAGWGVASIFAMLAGILGALSALSFATIKDADDK
jgi:MFS family permease